MRDLNIKKRMLVALLKQADLPIIDYDGYHLDILSIPAFGEIMNDYGLKIHDNAIVSHSETVSHFYNFLVTCGDEISESLYFASEQLLEDSLKALETEVKAIL